MAEIRISRGLDGDEGDIAKVPVPVDEDGSEDAFLIELPFSDGRIIRVAVSGAEAAWADEFWPEDARREKLRSLSPLPRLWRTHVVPLPTESEPKRLFRSDHDSYGRTPLK